MTTTIRSARRITSVVLIGLVVALLGACSTTVVREPSASSATRKPSQGKPGATVRVQRGDTLYGIAFRNGVDVNDLARWNGLGAPYTIYPGQTLKLYPGSSRPTTTPPRSTAGTTTRPTPPPAPVTRPAPAPAPANSGFAWRWPAEGHLIGRFVGGVVLMRLGDKGLFAGAARFPAEGAGETASERLQRKVGGGNGRGAGHGQGLFRRGAGAAVASAMTSAPWRKV